MIQSIGVFCGSSTGNDEAFASAARALGKGIAERGMTVIFGGGNVGLMGIVADAALAAGGKVIGVMPRFLEEKEIDHEGLTRLELVDSMHSRKSRMAELSDAFVALPGGFGTYEEFFEVVTWTQLSLQDKPCLLINVNDFYTPIGTLIQGAVTNGFMKPNSGEIVQICDTVDSAFQRLEAWRPGLVEEKWVRRRSG